MKHRHYFRKPDSTYGTWCYYGFGVMYHSECSCKKLKFICFSGETPTDNDYLIHKSLYKKWRKHLPKLDLKWMKK